MAKKSKKAVAEAMGVDVEHKPHLHLSEKDLPEIKSWNIDNEYTLTLKVEMTSVSKDEWEEDGKVRAGFKVLEVNAD